MGLIRLDKLVSKVLNISRKDAKKIISNGKITYDGEILKAVDIKLPENSKIEISGKSKSYIKNFYIMMNKPLGIVSSTNNFDGKNVLDILPDKLKRKGLFPAGRLDKYSHGMIIITDDGEFAHRMLSPVSHVPKVYYVLVDSQIVNESLKEEFAKGVFLGDGKYSSSSELEIINEYSAYVTIHEGIYHQIRRMFSRFGGEVVDLKRIKMGSLCLDNELKEGDSRLLTNEEVLLLLSKY